MFDCNHYVPILKAKDGEFGALSELPEEIKNQISPLIDIFNDKASRKSLDFRLNKIAIKLRTAWGIRRPIFIDPFGIDLDERISERVHPLSFVFNRLRDAEVQAIPSTGFDRDDAYNKAIRKIIEQDRRGVCIRLLRDDMESLDDKDDNLESLLNYFGVSCEDTHLLLDFRSLAANEIEKSTETTVNVMRRLPRLNEWRTITIAASGFPGSLKEIGTHSIGTLPRTEMRLWNAVVARKEEIDRCPSFGDYGVQNPDLLDLDWNSISLVSNIRYTLPSEWLILRGGSNKKNGWDQSHRLSRELTEMRAYYGKSFCWGDNYIDDCARRIVGPGNMTTWRKVGTNHHLTLVSSQIANSVDS